MENLATFISSPIFNIFIAIFLFIAQLYVANKIIPIKKDIDFLKENDKKKDEAIKEIYERCYDNHKEHRK
jgi:hypothetical protein